MKGVYGNRQGIVQSRVTLPTPLVKKPPLSTSVLAEAVHPHECVVANPQGNEFGLEAVPEFGHGDDGDQSEFLGRVPCRHQSISDWACDRDTDVIISLLFIKIAQNVETQSDMAKARAHREGASLRFVTIAAPTVFVALSSRGIINKT
jgi:hypothetical protein